MFKTLFFPAISAQVMFAVSLTMTAPAHAAPKAGPEANDCVEEMILDPAQLKIRGEFRQRIDELHGDIKRTLPRNNHGVALPALDTPDQVADVVKEIAAVLQKSSKQAQYKPDNARRAIVDALELLYTGRGNTTPRDGKGWSLAARRGATGLEEIKWILGQGILDEQGLKQFADFVATHDFDSDQAKKNAGFPPQLEINRPELRDQVQEMIARTSAGKAFHTDSHVLAADLDAAEEIISALRKNGGPEGPAAKLFFDPARIKAGEKFTEYYGRDEEANEITDVLSRGQKQHFLLQGKAGVGKTTIIKMLQYRFLQGKARIWDEKPPIFIELPITLLTNDKDPTALRSFLETAVEISKKVDRRIVLFADEAHVATPLTQNAMKAFLTEIITNVPATSKVNVALATTSGESRKFESDTAFMGRFAIVHVAEFTREQIIALIKLTNVPKWVKDHKKAEYFFDGEISEEAFEYAYRYRHQEQRHRETGTWELIEGAISSKLNRDTDSARTSPPKKGPFSIDVTDIQRYLREKFRMDLIPGDPHFEENFAKKWATFEADYSGNEGAKLTIRRKLKSHFGQLVRSMVTAFAVFGPPGGGKSFGAEKVAEVYFNGAMVTINGAEYKNGGLELNKLIGSPSGTVGSEEQRAILTKAIADHPNGFVLKIEEADYLHQDIVQFLTNLISNKKFTDGLGHEWDVNNIIVWANSNIGQEEMIPTDSTRNRMSWDQYAIRRNALTERQVIDGKTVEVARPEKLARIFERFIESIVTKSHPGQDTSEVAQETNKQKRRYEPIYILAPDKAELAQAGMNETRHFVETAKREYGVTLSIPPHVVEAAMDVDHYKFEMGYSYVKEQLQRKIFDSLIPYLHMRGKSIHVDIEQSTIKLGNGREVASQNLKVSLDGGEARVINLGAVDNHEPNPWGSSPEMMRRILNFPTEMRKYIKGNTHVIQNMARKLKAKAFNWDTQMVFSLIGTSGNGKTETAKALAKVVYGSENAYFRIRSVDHPWALSDYFRPPTGIMGSDKETDFERWFKSHQMAGGGVILLDEFLSELKTKGSAQVDGRQGGKIAVLRDLYWLLDEQKIKMGGKEYDARGFIVLLTGNALQEIFQGIDDNPEAEQLVQKILGKLTPDMTMKSLEEVGLDAPLIARLGQVHVMGPQPHAVSSNVGQMKVEKAIHEMQALAGHSIEIDIDPKTIEAVVNRLTTIRLGMRAVDKGFEKFILNPLRSIIQDIDALNPLGKVEMKLVDGVPVWKVAFLHDPKSHLVTVALEAQPLGDGLFNESWKAKNEFERTAEDHTPQLKDLETVEKMKVSANSARETTWHEVFGHFMVEAILNHRNGADFISIIPGENYLGYVRPKEVEIYDHHTLLTLLKDTAMLDAGHRAVFKFGVFSAGGGNGGARKEGEAPSDDLGKLYQKVDVMIHNNMVSDVTEYSPGAKKQLFKKFVEQISAQIADAIIALGLESGQFNAIFDQALKNRYATAEDLENHVKSVDFAKIGNPDVLLSHYLSHAILQTIGSYPRLKDAAKEMVDRVIKESEVRNTGDGAILAQLREIHQNFEAKFLELKGSDHPRPVFPRRRH